MENKEIIETKNHSVESKENGELCPRTLESQFRLASYYKKAGLLPYQFDTTEKVLALMQFCYELNLKVMTASRQIMVINNTMSMWGDLPLALVRSSGLLKEFKETFFDKDGEEITIKNIKPVFAALCEAKRIDDQTHSEFFTIDDAKQAGLFGKKGDIWTKYTKDMLRYRPRARVLKSLFADVLGGVSIAEYDYSLKPDSMSQDELREQNSIITAERKQIKQIDVQSIKEKCINASEIFEAEPVDQQQILSGDLSDEAKKEILEGEKNGK